MRVAGSASGIETRTPLPVTSLHVNYWLSTVWVVTYCRRLLLSPFLARNLPRCNLSSSSSSSFSSSSFASCGSFTQCQLTAAKPVACGCANCCCRRLHGCCRWGVDGNCEESLPTAAVDVAAIDVGVDGNCRRMLDSRADGFAVTCQLQS